MPYFYKDRVFLKKVKLLLKFYYYYPTIYYTAIIYEIFKPERISEE